MRRLLRNLRGEVLNETHVEHDLLDFLHLLTVCIDFLLLDLGLYLIRNADHVSCLLLERIEILKSRLDLILTLLCLLLYLSLDPYYTAHGRFGGHLPRHGGNLNSSRFDLYRYLPVLLLESISKLITEFVSSLLLELEFQFVIEAGFPRQRRLALEYLLMIFNNVGRVLVQVGKGKSHKFTPEELLSFLIISHVEERKL